MVLEKLSSSLNSALRKLLRMPTIDEKAIKELVKDLQRALLQADVKVDLVFELSKNIQKRALSKELPPGITRREHVIKTVYNELVTVLGEKTEVIRVKPGQTTIIMAIGIQGSGKTTSCAKLAYFHKKKGFKTALVCGDTYRPAAFDQLSQLAASINVPIYGDPSEKDAIKLVNRGVEQFTEEKYEVIIVDTAGRHKDETFLIEEMKAIERAIHPHEIVLVIDGTLGQQAYIQAEAFKEATDIGSILVTKLDGSARGGGALSAVAATGAPIKFIGTGEKIEDLEKFNGPRFVGRLLGMGDLTSLLEKLKEAEITPSKKEAKVFLSGKFTLLDFREQIKKMGKIGPLSKIFSFLPGVANIPEELKSMSEEKVKRWEHILDSMRTEELINTKLLKRSRVVRVARGSGSEVKEVRELLQQYNMLRKLMKGMRGRRRMKGLPMMPGGLPDLPLDT
ncbi:MAG: signal recognition particle protein [Candidatus Lokiarchaeota archaeon]|nr:signal recognition particle protein [Candidatus Lokiarchaeota archaeon]